MTAILQVAVPAPMHRTFDYLPPVGIDPRTLRPGQRVEVPFGRHRKVGILLRVAATSDLPPEKLRAAGSILDDSPLLSATDLKLLNWASRYYHHPIGEVMASALTVLLRKGESAAPASLRRKPTRCSSRACPRCRARPPVWCGYWPMSPTAAVCRTARCWWPR